MYLGIISTDMMITYYRFAGYSKEKNITCENGSSNAMIIVIYKPLKTIFIATSINLKYFH